MNSFFYIYEIQQTTTNYRDINNYQMVQRWHWYILYGITITKSYITYIFFIIKI